jgi:hypothetical protein
MALKTLRCCGNSSLPEQRSSHTHPQPPENYICKLGEIGSGHTHPQPPENYIRKLGGMYPIHLKRQHRVQGLMWGARGPFPPAAAMVVAVVT